jgi:hypothetical protein
MSADCYLYRVENNLVRSEVYLGGNSTAADITHFASQEEGLENTSDERGYCVLPLSREQFVRFIKSDPTFYVDPSSVKESCRQEYRSPGQLQLVIKS